LEEREIGGLALDGGHSAPLATMLTGARA